MGGERPHSSPGEKTCLVASSVFKLFIAIINISHFLSINIISHFLVMFFALGFVFSHDSISIRFFSHISIIIHVLLSVIISCILCLVMLLGWARSSQACIHRTKHASGLDQALRVLP